jgi:hypothetical protein
MRPKKDMEQIIRTKLNLVFGPPRRDQLLTRALHEQEQSWEMEPTREEPVTRRMIMRSPMVKLGIVAAVIAVVGVGIMEFVGTGSQSGVLWAQAVKNVEASQGVIWRLRGTGSRDPNDDWPNAYKITWRSPAITRTDHYRGSQIYRTTYYNLDTKTVIGVLHDAHKYSKEAMSDDRVHAVRADKERWSDPQGLLNLALSLEHHALDSKTIDGVLCEGIEATGPNGLTGRLWVGAETGYPVLIEVEAVDGGGIRHTSTLDQFRWNVDLSAEGVEPEIPAGYDPL